MAIYGGQPPSDYYARQDQRKDDKFRDIINLFLTLSQNKRQKEQFGQQQDLQERKFAQEQAEWPTMRGYYEGRTEDMAAGPSPTPMMKDLQEIRRMFPEATEAEIFKIYGDKSGISVYEEKLTYAQDVLKLPPKQAGYFAGGVPPKEPSKTPGQLLTDSMFRQMGTELGKGAAPTELGYEGPKGSPQRNAWVKNVDRFYKEMDDAGTPTTPKEYMEERYELDATPDQRPITPSGLYLDMPRKYNYARFAKDNEVASAEDLDTIRKYDDMFRLFKEVLLPRYYRDEEKVRRNGRMVKESGFVKFMRSDVARDSDLDIRQLKDWYDLYDK